MIHHLSLESLNWERFLARLRAFWAARFHPAFHRGIQWWSPERLWLAGGALLLALFIWALISGYHPTH